MRLGRRIQAEDGFSLIEAAVAGGLLLIALIGGVGVFDSSRRESATGERQEIAALQAQAEIERLRDVEYADLAIDPDAAEQWVASGSPGDPVNRIEGATTRTFRVGANLTEDLAFAGTAGEGIDAQTPFSATMGDSTRNGQIYRFVSWRDEECPVADVSGVTGPLADLTGPPVTMIDGLLASGSLLNTLLGPLFNILAPVVRDRVDDARSLTEGIDAQLAPLVAAIGGIEEIDPCDADVETLNEIEDGMTSLGPLLTELDSRINAYHAGCTKVLGLIVSCPGTGSGLYTNLNAAITNLENEDYEAALADLTASLGEAESADHTHNTKRVTVAVVFDPRSGSGPFKPVWATSVVSNPDEGLLAP